MKRRSLSCLSLLAVALGAVGLGTGDAAQEPMFTREIVRIFQQHCQECHRAGGSAPFPLITYDHAFRRRDKILETTRARTMPSWRPVAGYGDLAGERRLSPEEIATIRRWVDAGGPQGDPADLPAPRVFETVASGGTPDLVLRPDVSYTVAAKKLRTGKGSEGSGSIARPRTRPSEATPISKMLQGRAGRPALATNSWRTRPVVPTVGQGAAGSLG